MTTTRPARRDEGSALIMVMGAMTVAIIVVSVALNYAMQTMGTAQHATSWNQAFAAAEAGVDDFLARLNKDDNYWQITPADGHVHLGDTHWDSQWDCDNEALQRAFDVAHPPCDWGDGTETGWAPVNGSPRSQFHYDVDVTSTPVNGTIVLVSTGRVGSVTRSIEVTLRRGGFGEFLYATTYETKDPADYSNPETKFTQCAKYYWAGRNPDNCDDITFIGGDKLNGPVHSNDSILMTDNWSTTPRGPWFTGTVTTSDPSCKPVNGVPRDPQYCFRGSAHPRFDKGIAYRSAVDLPESTGDLRQYVAAPDPLPPGWKAAGCLYTGATRIKFKQTATGSGTMKVWSPGSTGTNMGGADCGDPDGPWPQDNLPVPPNGLIFVQNTPTDQTLPAAGRCATGVLGTVTGGASLPSADDYNQTLAASDCRLGTAYVEGTLKGRVTVSAQNNVVITGDLTYQGGENGTDALGLIADNSVQIYHPISKGQCTQDSGHWEWSWRYGWKWISGPCIAWARGSNNLTGTVYNVQVNASILTLNHSFEVQQYDVGSNSCVSGPACLGKLHVFGSIAQKFRGAVGRGSAGYLKDYNYDSRLRYAPPPYFLDPVRSSWGQKTFGEVAPRYGD